jgi:hypothetical protein
VTAVTHLQAVRGRAERTAQAVRLIGRPEPELGALLAHERAHLACHHHRFLAIARIGRQVFPFIPLMRDAAGTDAVHRIQRLLAPAEPLGRVRRHLLRAGAAGLALVPLVLALTPAVVALALGRVQPA